MSGSNKLTINGVSLDVEPGETILTVANRAGISIPTLCHDPRLKPAGACRTCLVEVDGQRRLHPACAFPASEGMQITTESERITRHRQTLLSFYAADHQLNGKQNPDNELESMIADYGTSIDIGHLKAPLLCSRARRRHMQCRRSGRMTN